MQGSRRPTQASRRARRLLAIPFAALALLVSLSAFVVPAGAAEPATSPVGTSPQVPDFVVTGRSDTAVALKWGFSGITTAGWDVLQDGVKIKSVDFANFETTVTGLTPNTTYRFELESRPIDPQGFPVPIERAVVSATTLPAGQDEIFPSEPRVHEPQTVLSGGAYITWDPSTDDQGGVTYEVLDDDDGELIKTVSEPWVNLVGISARHQRVAVWAVDAAGNRTRQWGPPVWVSLVYPGFDNVRTYDLQCRYPGVGNFAAQVEAFTKLGSELENRRRGRYDLAYAVNLGAANAPALLAAGVTTLEGQSSLAVTFRSGTESKASGVSAAVTPRPVIDPDGFIVPGTGSFDTYLPSGGTARLSVTGVTLNLTARDGAGEVVRPSPAATTDSDGDPDTFDVPCTLDPADQDPVLATTVLTPVEGQVPPRTTALPPATGPAAKFVRTYQCTFPLAGELPVELDLDAYIPSTARIDVLTPEARANAKLTLGGNVAELLDLVGASRVEGGVGTRLRLDLPNGASRVELVPFALSPFAVPTYTGPGTIALDAAGAVPSLRYTEVGTTRFGVDSLVLSLSFFKSNGIAIIFPGADTDSDDDASTFDVSCRLDPSGQDTTLTTVSVLSNPPITPIGTTVPATSPAGSTPPTTPIATTPVGTTVQPTTFNIPPRTTQGTTPRTTPPTTPPVVVPTGPGTTPKTTPITTPPASLYLTYDLAGSATLKTLVRGSVPLRGLLDVDFELGWPTFTADLTLQPASAKLKALGFLPVTADLTFAPTAPVTGKFQDGELTATAKVRIKVPRVSLFGLQLGGGANCQTKQPSAIALHSTQPPFVRTAGGPLAGRFAISDLTGCGSLTGLISPLTAGKGNVVSLNLAPWKR